MKKAEKTVDAYIKAAPKEVQAKLTQLRRIIKSTAPKAEERISYAMPYYKYNGPLAYFASAKTHIGLYISPPILAEHKTELKNYSTSRATIRFPLKEKLPIKLIQKLVKAKMKHNESKK